MTWHEWMMIQNLDWNNLLADLENAPIVKSLLQKASQDFLAGRENAAGIAEIVGILAGDI